MNLSRKNKKILNKRYSKKYNRKSSKKYNKNKIKVIYGGAVINDEEMQPYEKQVGQTKIDDDIVPMMAQNEMDAHIEAITKENKNNDIKIENKPEIKKKGNKKKAKKKKEENNNAQEPHEAIRSTNILLESIAEGEEKDEKDERDEKF